ncbi:hypothetical protein L484_007891 [Morus notabilis]|uniref:Uncharacterized protein n=1 Tax=Morus notabilis TaxID=981085 RepID=W9S223_9ROSA|nr:hypothetical protein L484_007891 [Morus notabilis]
MLKEENTIVKAAWCCREQNAKAQRREQNAKAQRRAYGQRNSWRRMTRCQSDSIAANNPNPTSIQHSYVGVDIVTVKGRHSQNLPLEFGGYDLGDLEEHGLGIERREAHGFGIWRDTTLGQGGIQPRFDGSQPRVMRCTT